MTEQLWTLTLERGDDDPTGGIRAAVRVADPSTLTAKMRREVLSLMAEGLADELDADEGAR